MIFTLLEIKFQILSVYEIKTSKMKILALSEDLSQIQWYTFSQKWEKMPDLGFGTSYKDELCPKLYVPAQPKLGPQKVLYFTSCPF